MKPTLLTVLVSSVWAWARTDAEHLATEFSRRDTVGSHPFAKFKLHGPRLEPDEAPASPKDSAVAPPLECFQVSEPVLTPAAPSLTDNGADEGSLGETACDIVLMEHTFANSYGAPFVGTFRTTPVNRTEQSKLTCHKATTRLQIVILTMWSLISLSM